MLIYLKIDSRGTTNFNFFITGEVFKKVWEPLAYVIILVELNAIISYLKEESSSLLFVVVDKTGWAGGGIS